MSEIRRELRAFLCDLGMREESERVQPVVDRDQDDASSCESLTIELHLRGISVVEPSSEYPDHYGQFLICAFCGSPDIKLQTVFTHRYLRIDMPLFGIECIGIQAWRLLHCDRSEPGTVSHAFPVRCRLRRSPAELTDRRRGVWDPFESGYPGICRRNTADQAVFYSDFS